MLCFVLLCVRGAVFAASNDPSVIVAAQLLDGISAATLGVLVPLVIADTTRGTGHFNFAQGVVGVAAGNGASLGTTMAGYVADMFWRRRRVFISRVCRSVRPLAGACAHARNAGSGRPPHTFVPDRIDMSTLPAWAIVDSLLTYRMIFHW
jgi:MFS family permease